MTLLTLARVVSAIAAVTADPLERNLLWITGLEESMGYREDVIDCRVKGDRGHAHGAWQVWPRTAEEARLLCTSLEDAARIALDRMRESFAMCAGYPIEERLSAYCAGACNSDAGRAISRRRFRKARGE